jgi:hypothetical protein
MSFCTNCGAKLGVSDNFCSACSQKVTTNFDEAAESSSNATDHEDIKRDFWWISFANLLVYLLFEQVRSKTGDFDAAFRFFELIIICCVLWYAIFVKAVKENSTTLLTFFYIAMILQATIFYSFFFIEDDDFFSTRYWTTKTYAAPFLDFLILVWIGKIRSRFKVV